MHNCSICNRSFEKSRSLAAHFKWCNPETRPDLSGENNPMFGKTGKNQWTNSHERPFETIGWSLKRKILIEEANFSCTVCKFSEKRKDGTCILQIDHIDGNRNNNTRENLRVVCPNCHALTSEKFMHIGQKHTDESRAKITAGLIQKQLLK
jgi:hypothetical protein